MPRPRVNLGRVRLLVLRLVPLEDAEAALDDGERQKLGHLDEELLQGAGGVFLKVGGSSVVRLFWGRVSLQVSPQPSLLFFKITLKLTHVNFNSQRDPGHPCCTYAKYNRKFSSSKKHAKWCGVPLKCSAGVSNECVGPPHVAAAVAVVGEGGLHDHEGGELADLDQGLLKIVSSEAKRVRELWRGGTFAIKWAAISSHLYCLHLSDGLRGRAGLYGDLPLSQAAPFARRRRRRAAAVVVRVWIRVWRRRRRPGVVLVVHALLLLPPSSLPTVAGETLARETLLIRSNHRCISGPGNFFWHFFLWPDDVFLFQETECAL